MAHIKMKNIVDLREGCSPKPWFQWLLERVQKFDYKTRRDQGFSVLPFSALHLTQQLITREQFKLMPRGELWTVVWVAEWTAIVVGGCPLTIIAKPLMDEWVDSSPPKYFCNHHELHGFCPTPILNFKLTAIAFLFFPPSFFFFFCHYKDCPCHQITFHNGGYIDFILEHHRMNIFQICFTYNWIFIFSKNAENPFSI